MKPFECKQEDCAMYCGLVERGAIALHVRAVCEAQGNLSQICEPEAAKEIEQTGDRCGTYEVGDDHWHLLPEDMRSAIYA